MRHSTRLLAACLGLALLFAACGGDAGPGTSTTATTSAPTTTEAPTTIAPTTATEAPTTTAVEPGFTAEILRDAVLQNGDPWVVVVAGAELVELTLDMIWPADRFPDERAIYEAAGFQAGSFAMFTEENGVLITGAHLFGDAAGAAAALDVIAGSFSTPDLVAEITGLEPGSLTTALPLGDLRYGDRAVGVILSGPELQVAGIIWITDNLLQFVRAAMVLGDEDRTAAVFAVADAMAGRLG